MHAQQLAEKMRFMEPIHAQDERLPIDALEFETHVIQRLLERMNKARQ